MKRQTKDSVKVERAAERRQVFQAWNALKNMGLLKKGARGASRKFPCPQCDACMCEPAITQRSSAKQKEKFAQELARAQLPEHSIWFRGSRCCRLYSAVRFTVLPIRKTTWPLPQVAAFVQEYAEMPVPSLQALCRQVGVSRCTTSKTLFKWLLGQEAALGYARMQRCKLRGALEGDGTCLKLFRRAQANFHVALWGLVGRPGSAKNPKCLIYLLPVKKTAANSVCPVESRADILSTGGLEQIERCLRSGRDTKSLLLTDGAQVYGRLAKEYGLSHRFVVHSKGQFSEMQRLGPITLLGCIL